MNFLKKKVKKAFESLTSDDGPDDESSLGGNRGSFHSSSSGAGAENYVFLHGTLLFDINSAEDLPDMESWIAKIYDGKDVTDPFIDVTLENAKLAKTSVVLNDLNPQWNESFKVELCHWGANLNFEVRDKDHAYTEYIGMVQIPASDLISSGISGNSIEGNFPIVGRKGKTKGTLNIRVQYIPVASIQNSYDVGGSYFTMSKGNRVRLYQDAHCAPPQMVPYFAQMQLPPDYTSFSSDSQGSPNYHPASCWKDLYQAIQGAEKLICINGWAVWDKLLLHRGEDLSIDNRTLGELLIDKAENQGVQVYVMVWSEKTSGEVMEKGFMNTHDMETFNLFENTKIKCALAPRELECNELTDYLQNEFASGTYTHHQKSVIVDAPIHTLTLNDDSGMSGTRRLMAFVGGLDLTGGRWDTPSHELFSTLMNEHLNDFRNSNAKSVSPEQGPRQPWHDIHMRVEGPAAHDIFMNFYERWLKQGHRYGRLDPIDRHWNIDTNVELNDATSWNCQFFRSITSDSVSFDTRPEKCGSLNAKKGREYESSICKAYVQSIRNAKNFLYIENQYFLGSAYSWLKDEKTNCHHTIPAEIAQKIVDKIFAGERFCAYIVIPMFPEGDPTSAPMQEILYWQSNTMEMMYRRVADALVETGAAAAGSHPTDWLLFMCPGKREAPGPHLDALAEPTEEFATRFRQTMRNPIYVHSKMMIVDDSYIIVGSANINQRSMSGTRDTEMAIGAWQPMYTVEVDPEISGGGPYGDIHAFRMSLWTEHFRHWDPLFRFPAQLECTQKVKEMAAYNWQVYSMDAEPGNFPVTPGQLLSYPLNIMEDGSVEYLPNISTFPDYGPNAKIMGKTSAMLPVKLTT